MQLQYNQLKNFYFQQPHPSAHTTQHKLLDYHLNQNNQNNHKHHRENCQREGRGGEIYRSR